MHAPSHGLALFNQARLCAAKQQWDKAHYIFEQLAQQVPQDVEVQLELAECKMAKHVPEASTELERAIENAVHESFDPLRIASARALIGEADVVLGTLSGYSDVQQLTRMLEVCERLRRHTDGNSIRHAYSHVARVGEGGKFTPSLRAQIASALALPFVYHNQDHILKERYQFELGLSQLEQGVSLSNLQQCAPSLDQLLWTNQMLAYQGFNDCALMRRYGLWLQQALAVFAPQWSAPPIVRRQGPLRVGFVSAGFRGSAIGSYFASWPRALIHPDIAVHAFLLDTPKDATTAIATTGLQGVWEVDGTVERMATCLSESGMDLLIYPDVGIDPKTTLLAALHLAPQQWVAWGHPETTGLTAIDRFISCSNMESREFGSHYTEGLLLLPGAGTAFADPGQAEDKARSDFGFHDNQHLYLVPHVPPKIHPDCDALFAQVAAQDSQAVLIFFRSGYSAACVALEQRLHAAFHAAGADPKKQIRFFPYLPRKRFLNLCALSDVMLDTLHWSGGANTVDALFMGLPVVTCPGPLMRSRQTLGMLTACEIGHDWICSTKESYVAKAIELASDRTYRHEQGRQIRTHSVELLQGTSALAALRNAVFALV